MKSAVLTSSLLFLSSLTCASASVIPRNIGSANIVISTGDGDSATTLRANLGRLTPTTAQSARGVKAELRTDRVFCVAFSDRDGLQEVGRIFDSDSPAQYSRNGNAIPLGSFYCATSLAQVERQVNMAGDIPNNSNNNNNKNSNNNNNNNNNNANGGKTVTLQFEIEGGTTFRQETVAVNSIPVALRFVRKAVGFSIVSASSGSTNGISCQAFNNGRKVGNAATANRPAELSSNDAVQISTVECQASLN